MLLSQDSSLSLEALPWCSSYVIATERTYTSASAALWHLLGARMAAVENGTCKRSQVQPCKTWTRLVNSVWLGHFISQTLVSGRQHAGRAAGTMIQATAARTSHRHCGDQSWLPGSVQAKRCINSHRYATHDKAQRLQDGRSFNLVCVSAVINSTPQMFGCLQAA